MAFSRGSRHLVRSQRRKMEWDLGPEARDVSIAATGSVLWTTGGTPLIPGLTAIRHRGHVDAFLRSATAIGDGFIGAHAIGIVSVAAFTAGVASCPTPITEISWDWIWHQFFDVRIITGTIADGVNAANVSSRIDIDSKAMRKFGLDEVLFGVTEVVESGTADMEIQADVRSLFKLP